MKLFKQNLTEVTFFYQHSQPLHVVLQEEIENLEFDQVVKFELIDSLKNDITKSLLVFDISCEEICNSELFVDTATAGRNRGLSTIYIKCNLFHQIKLGRDVKLQDTHTVVVSSLREVMQISTFGALLGLGSKPVDWY